MRDSFLFFAKFFQLLIVDTYQRIRRMHFYIERMEKLPRVIIHYYPRIFFFAEVQLTLLNPTYDTAERERKTCSYPRDILCYDRAAGARGILQIFCDSVHFEIR